MSALDLASILLGAAIAGATPILLAGLGELVSERAGVLNVGVEGIMAGGAVTGALVAARSGSPILGMLAALLAGALLALVHALPVIFLRVNQVVSGLAVLALGTGLSAALGQAQVGRPSPSFSRLELPALSKIPLLGPALFQQHALVWLGLLLAVAVGLALRRTRAGLILQFCGEQPRLVDALGVNVAAVRLGAALFGGAMAGLGGAAISLAETPTWTEGMVAGRGWIALAIVIFSGWSTRGVVLGAWLFGGLVALQFRAQAFGVELNAYALKMLPYVATIAVLAITARRGRGGAPAALGEPYAREERG